MAKRWTLNNGWQRKNNSGQMVLCEIGPSDFDPDHNLNQQHGTAPYRRVGSAYVFAHKRDFDAAVETLRQKGYIA